MVTWKMIQRQWTSQHFRDGWMNSYWKFQPLTVNNFKTFVHLRVNLNLLTKLKSVEQFRSFRQSAIITVCYQSNKPQLIKMHSWFKLKIYMHNSKCTRLRAVWICLTKLSCSVVHCGIFNDLTRHRKLPTHKSST